MKIRKDPFMEVGCPSRRLQKTNPTSRRTYGPTSDLLFLVFFLVCPQLIVCLGGGRLRPFDCRQIDVEAARDALIKNAPRDNMCAPVLHDVPETIKQRIG